MKYKAEGLDQLKDKTRNFSLKVSKKSNKNYLKLSTTISLMEKYQIT